MKLETSQCENVRESEKLLVTSDNLPPNSLIFLSSSRISISGGLQWKIRCSVIKVAAEDVWFQGLTSYLCPCSKYSSMMSLISCLNNNSLRTPRIFFWEV